MTEEYQGYWPPSRPARPNEHWKAGERARYINVARDACPLDYAGSRWEWEAGWDDADYQIKRHSADNGNCPHCANGRTRETSLDDVIRRAYCGEMEGGGFDGTVLGAGDVSHMRRLTRIQRAVAEFVNDV